MPSIVLLVAVLFGLASLPAVAQTTNAIQTWPTKPITLVVPFPAGSASDVVARILSPRLGEILKKQVIIENVAGAGGTTGALRVARAKTEHARHVIKQDSPLGRPQPEHGVAHILRQQRVVSHPFLPETMYMTLPSCVIPQLTLHGPFPARRRSRRAGQP